MPRGGPRQGIAGKRYPNRSDMNLGPRKLPVSTAPDQPYGEAGQQQQAQQAVPMASGPLPQQVGESAQQFQPPPVVPMGAPSMNPTEHVMSGLGAPAVQQPLAQPPAVKGAALLAAFGDNAPIQVKALRDALNVAAMNGSGA